MGGTNSIDLDVRKAAQRWARGVFGAPRAFADLIVGVDVRDEVIERVATEVVRRDVREERIGSNRRSPTPPRIDPRQVDPFEVSPEALRAQSEYVAPCGCCRGSGVYACGTCRGTGRAPCYTCGGGGKMASPKTGRPINCKGCRATGTVPCGTCGKSGSVPCAVCTGSGNQLCWLTYDQRVFWKITIEPQSPIVAAHRQLQESRFIRREELAAFRIVETDDSPGTTEARGYREAERPVVRAIAASIEPRLERVNRQQYVKLAVVRRDARFEMAGTTGTLVLSGNELVGSHDGAAVRPIKRRLYASLLLIGIVAVGSGAALASFSGGSAYFARSNVVLTVLWIATLSASLPAVAALARAWRPGPRLGALSVLEKVVAGATVACLLALVIVGMASQPRAKGVTEALARGDVASARATVDALLERSDTSAETRSLEDSVMIAEAKRNAGTDRLKVLDAVVARHGSGAAEAAALARTERLGQIKALNDSGKALGALAILDEHFSGKWKLDAELAEERARAFDLLLARCSTAACKLDMTAKAESSAPTASRRENKAQARASALQVLQPIEVSGEDVLPRLKRLRSAAGDAAEVLEVARGDEEVAAAAYKTAQWAATERAKVPLIGAEPAAVAELLGASVAGSTDEKAAMLTVETSRVYLTLDPSKRTRGIYIVGATKESRAIVGRQWPAERLLAQAVGHSTTLKKPTPPETVTSRWWETPAPVVARFKGDQLTELRIGDATP